MCIDELKDHQYSLIGEKNIIEKLLKLYHHQHNLIIIIRDNVYIIYKVASYRYMTHPMGYYISLDGPKGYSESPIIMTMR
jgi:hypothetical protein